MDITATFLGLCKAKKALDENVSKALQKNRPEPTATILPKPPQTEFQKRALELLAFISQIREKILRQKKEFLDPHSTLTDADRTELESDVLTKLQDCNEAIKKLKTDVHHNRTPVKVHRTEVLWILDAYLAAVSRLLTDQQAIRVKRALDQAKMSKLETFGSKAKKVKVVLPAESTLPYLPRKAQVAVPQSSALVEEQELSRRPVPKPSDTFSTEELIMFASENANLYEELSGMEDEVRVIENQMTEISRMQQVFTEHVVLQEIQIDNVAAAAVGATENIKSGNIDIREAIQKTASFRAWILFVVLVLSFTLLFLDWYNE
ncbi:putative Syntaxin-18 [Hypsibius exemplaris]|uniref:Syntaxin-18 n=1 Tax=Hypsibius exemplaris TaxID=2072580 RepID=A0A1W0XAT9_HYPEX|nr:putative Syntaxin-18 [Hypsibius exemplaris]